MTLARTAYRRLIVLLLAFSILVGLPAGAIAGPIAGPVAARERPRVIAEDRVGPRLVDLTIESPALGGTAKVRLLTPDGWERRSPMRRWPVLLLLHGCCGDYTNWTTQTKIEDLPELRNVLVVMPEAGTAGFYSDWRQGPGWESFHLREVRSIVERSYGAGSRRVVAGLSMGGFGALSYTARHPGLFRAAASYSGVVDTRNVSGAGDLVLGLVRGAGLDPLALWGDPDRDARTWAAHNPADLARRLRHLPVFLSCGDGTTGPLDPPDRTSALETLLLQENQLLADRLRQFGADRVELSFYGPGTHAWAYWERELRRSLPLLLDALRS